MYKSSCSLRLLRVLCGKKTAGTAKYTKNTHRDCKDKYIDCDNRIIT